MGETIRRGILLTKNLDSHLKNCRRFITATALCGRGHLLVAPRASAFRLATLGGLLRSARHGRCSRLWKTTDAAGTQRSHST